MGNDFNDDAVDEAREPDSEPVVAGTDSRLTKEQAELLEKMRERLEDPNFLNFDLDEDDNFDTKLEGEDDDWDKDDDFTDGYGDDAIKLDELDSTGKA